MLSNPYVDDTQPESLDAIDRLLSDYFKSQLRQPWPTAPREHEAEPSTTLAERTGLAESPRNHQHARDSSGRARYTLAASVALFLGTCWYLSTGFQPVNRNEPTPVPGGMLSGAGASKPAALEELKKDAAIKGEKAPPRQPMQLP
jgi:hypothetical protein